MNFVKPNELRLYNFLITLSLMYFYGGYKLFYTVNNFNHLELLFYPTVLLSFSLVFFPVNKISNVLFFFFFSFLEFSFSRYVKNYSTNIIAILQLLILVSVITQERLSKTSIYALLSAIYFFSGASKALYGFHLWISHSGELAKLGGGGLVLFELCAPLFIYYTKYVNYYLIALVLFHLLMLCMYSINFFPFVLPVVILSFRFRKV